MTQHDNNTNDLCNQGLCDHPAHWTASLNNRCERCGAPLDLSDPETYSPLDNSGWAGYICDPCYTRESLDSEPSASHYLMDARHRLAASCIQHERLIARLAASTTGPAAEGLYDLLDAISSYQDLIRVIGHKYLPRPQAHERSER